MSDGLRRRSSIFPGLLLILLGLLFLLDRFYPAFELGHLIRLYWPVLIILWGVAKLIDHLAARRSGQSSPSFISGGEVALMILLAFVLAAFALRDWIHDRYPDVDFEIGLSLPYSQTRQLAPETIPAGAHVMIETARGKIAVHAGGGSDMRVGVSESASASSKIAADERMKNAEVVIEHTGDNYSVHPAHQRDIRGAVVVDLDIELPKTASVEVYTGRGDIQISGVAGSVVARTASGDIGIHDTGSDVAADLQKGDAKIAGVAGNVKITGRGNDVDLSNVSGDAAVDGAFVGTIHANNVAKTIRFASPWCDVTIAHLTGSLEADSGDIEISDAGGPLKLITHNKDIDVKNVSGRIEIVNTHGDVKVSYSSPPQDALSITNDSGDADVTMPATSNFGISATSRSGEVNNQFEGPSLKASDEEGHGQITGKYGTGGPMITIATSYGTIHLRKAG